MRFASVTLWRHPGPQCWGVGGWKRWRRAVESWFFVSWRRDSSAELFQGRYFFSEGSGCYLKRQGRLRQYYVTGIVKINWLYCQIWNTTQWALRVGLLRCMETAIETFQLRHQNRTHLKLALPSWSTALHATLTHTPVCKATHTTESSRWSHTAHKHYIVLHLLVLHMMRSPRPSLSRRGRT